MKDLSYYWLGHIAHLLTDMSVPAHTHLDKHLEYSVLGVSVIGQDDSYEEYMGKNNDMQPYNFMRWSSSGLSIINYNDLYISPGSYNYNGINGWNEEKDWDKIALFKLFVNLAEKSDDYDSDGGITPWFSNGEITNGSMKIFNENEQGYDISDDNCRKIGHILMPLAMQYVAGLYQLFWDATHPTIPPVYDAGGPYSGFSDQEINLTGTVTDGDQIKFYRWNFGDGSNIWESTSNATISHRYNEGTYTAIFTVEFNDGTIISDDTQVSVFPPPSQYGYLYVLSYPSGAEIYINGNSIGYTTTETIRWPVGIYTIKLVKLAFNDFIKENVEVLEGKTTRVDAGQLSRIVSPWWAPPKTLAVLNETLELIGPSHRDITQWQWTDNLGETIDNGQTTHVKFTKTGVHTITLKVWDAIGPQEHNETITVISDRDLSLEINDGKDNDVDGLIDEGFKEGTIGPKSVNENASIPEYLGGALYNYRDEGDKKMSGQNASASRKVDIGNTCTVYPTSAFSAGKLEIASSGTLIFQSRYKYVAGKSDPGYDYAHIWINLNKLYSSGDREYFSYAAFGTAPCNDQDDWKDASITLPADILQNSIKLNAAYKDGKIGDAPYINVQNFQLSITIPQPGWQITIQTVNENGDQVNGQIYLKPLSSPGPPLFLLGTGTVVQTLHGNETYEIHFGTIDGYATPNPITLGPFNSDQIIRGIYRQNLLGRLVVRTYPVSGQILLNGENVGNGTYDDIKPIGSYIVSFGKVNGWQTPNEIAISLTTTGIDTTGIYFNTPPETIIINTVTGTDARFEYSGSDNETPKSNLKFAFYLQGYDTSYSSFSSDTLKSYSNLLPKDYVFYVKAKDEAGLEDPTPASFSFTVVPSGGLADSAWPMFRQNTQHTGRGIATVAASSMIKWKFQTENRIISSPAIGSDGTVYVGSYDTYLYAVTSDGSLKWKFKTDYGVESSPAIGFDGTIYFGSTDYFLYAVTSGGILKWKFKTGGGVQSSPVIGSDGTVYIGSWDNNIYALKSDGTLKWKFQTGSNVKSSPAIDSDGTIYVGSLDNNIYALKSDGTLKWKFQTGSYVWSSIAIGPDGTVYVGSDDTYLYALKSVLSKVS